MLPEAGERDLVTKQQLCTLYLERNRCAANTSPPLARRVTYVEQHRCMSMSCTSVSLCSARSSAVLPTQPNRSPVPLPMLPCLAPPAYPCSLPCQKTLTVRPATQAETVNRLGRRDWIYRRQSATCFAPFDRRRHRYSRVGYIFTPTNYSATCAQYVKDNRRDS